MAKSDIERIASYQKGEDPKKKFVDDGRRYIFPADETAPGANFAPKTTPAPTPEDVAIKVDVPATQPAPEQEFVDPNAAPAERQPATSPIPSYNPVDSYRQGLDMEASALEQQGRQEANAYQNTQKQLQGVDQELQKVQSNEQKAFEDFQKEDAEVSEKIKNFELKPANFFTGKSTWQKVLGGIGMFLGSITPQGAQNVAKIINAEIDRDLERQKQELALLKDTRSDATNRYKMKLDRLGSDKLAKMSMKKDILEMTKLQLEQIAANSKGQMARGKAMQGIAVIEQNQQKIQAELAKEYAKMMEKQQEGKIPGYKGTINDPTAARQLREQMAEKDGVLAEINNLMDINTKFLGGTLSTDARASAQQSQNMLIGKLRLAIVGPGAVSDGERELLKDAIANPTNFFSLKSSNELKLKKLKEAYLNKVESNLRYYGLEKEIPRGARKIE